MISMWGRSLRASATQRLTYFRRPSHATFLPFASALHELIACLSARLSALDSLPASATVGINAVLPAKTMVIRHVETAAAKRDIRQFPPVMLCGKTYDKQQSRPGL